MKCWRCFPFWRVKWICVKSIMSKFKHYTTTTTPTPTTVSNLSLFSFRYLRYSKVKWYHSDIRDYKMVKCKCLCLMRYQNITHYLVGILTWFLTLFSCCSFNLDFGPWTSLALHIKTAKEICINKCILHVFYQPCVVHFIWACYTYGNQIAHHRS